MRARPYGMRAHFLRFAGRRDAEAIDPRGLFVVSGVTGDPAHDLCELTDRHEQFATDVGRVATLSTKAYGCAVWRRRASPGFAR